MTAMLVKLVLTPLLVGAASLAARRWGSRVAGWLAGFPFTSAPVALILFLEHGPRFVATAASATILGVFSQAAFCIAYAWCARRWRWPVCFAAGTLAFGACTIAFSRLGTGPLVDALLAVAGLSLALWRFPDAGPEGAPVTPPGWDLPARIAVATTFVLVITALAASLGPTLTGLITPFPLYASVLGIFAHVHDGPASASGVMRGLLTGLYGFTAFFVVLAILVPGAGAVAAFGAAAAAVIAVQAVAFRVGRVIPRLGGEAGEPAQALR